MVVVLVSDIFFVPQVLSRQIAELGIYPAVDPLDSTSRMLDPRVIGDVHYETARATQKLLQDYKGLQVGPQFILLWRSCFRVCDSRVSSRFCLLSTTTAAHITGFRPSTQPILFALGNAWLHRNTKSSYVARVFICHPTITNRTLEVQITN